MYLQCRARCFVSLQAYSHPHDPSNTALRLAAVALGNKNSRTQFVFRRTAVFAGDRYAAPRRRLRAPRPSTAAPDTVTKEAATFQHRCVLRR